VKTFAFARFLAAAFCLLAALPGCKPKTTPSSDNAPSVLRLGYAPSEETVADREQSSRELAAYLERAVGIRVEVVRTASYGPAIEAMARGEIDIMSLGPLAYLLASRRGLAEPLVVTGSVETGPRTYQSALITHRRTGLTHLADLPARAASLRFNYTDPASNSGHLVPQARLARLGLTAEKSFASVDFTLSHSVAIFNVAFDRADVAGVSATVLSRLIAKGRVSADDLVVLWRSDLLPLGPVAVRPVLPAALKSKLRRALIELRTRDPAAARVVMAQYPEAGLTYLPGDDSLYAGLRELADGVEPPK
jgi:phosphonate transport system substrate-binding protein